MKLSKDWDVSKLTGADLQRIHARGRAIQAAETRHTVQRAAEMIRRWWG